MLIFRTVLPFIARGVCHLEFRNGKFKSGHRVLKANLVLESIAVRLKVIFFFLTRARDAMEE